MNQLPHPFLCLLIIGELVTAVQLLECFRGELVVGVALSNGLQTGHLPGRQEVGLEVGLDFRGCMWGVVLDVEIGL